MQPPVIPNNPILWAPLFERASNANLSLQGRVRQTLVSAILSGHLRPGAAAPSSRHLADSLEISRNTVVFAYQQLVAEGYLVSKERSGHFVANDITKGNIIGASTSETNPTCASINTTDWSQRLSSPPSRQRNIIKPANWQTLPYPFVYGQFDATQFPTAEWRGCCAKALSVLDINSWAPDLITHDDSALIHEIRTRILPRRGIWAEKEEIVITVGAQHALYLLADLLVHSHTVVGMEDPGYPDARNIFIRRTRRLVPLPIDEQGLCVTSSLKECDYLFVTPSHQCPTTVTLSMERREALLALVNDADNIIIEDDYETENCYNDEPNPALKSLDKNGRVIYIGSLSKSFAPGLRIGYIVAPKQLAHELRALRRLMLRHPSAYIQRIFAIFISLGHYHSLLRRLSLIYQERAQLLSDALSTYLPEFEYIPINGGSSCWVTGPSSLDSQKLAHMAERQGVFIEPGNVFYRSVEQGQHNRFRLGFSSIDSKNISAGIEQLSHIYRELRDL